MTLVGVISDTHGKLDSRAYAALVGCDSVVHAGDICDPSILRELETIAPVSAVLGNNDFPSEYPSSVGRFARLTIEGVHFLVAHYPTDVQIGFAGSSAVAPGDPIPQICIHGHTHVPRLDWGKAAYPARFVLNPGSATRPRGGFSASIARIRLSDSAIESIVVKSLEGERIFSFGG